MWKPRHTTLSKFFKENPGWTVTSIIGTDEEIREGIKKFREAYPDYYTYTKTIPEKRTLKLYVGGKLVKEVEIPKV